METLTAYLISGGILVIAIAVGLILANRNQAYRRIKQAEAIKHYTEKRDKITLGHVKQKKTPVIDEGTSGAVSLIGALVGTAVVMFVGFNVMSQVMTSVCNGSGAANVTSGLNVISCTTGAMADMFKYMPWLMGAGMIAMLFYQFYGRWEV